MEDKNIYPKGPLKVPGRIDQLLESYPNLYADLSANSALNALSRDHSYTCQFIKKHYKKLLFGLDRFVREEEPRMIELLRKLDLPSDIQKAIFSGNAIKLLSL